MNGRELHEAVYAGEKVDRLPLSGLGPGPKRSSAGSAKAWELTNPLLGPWGWRPMKSSGSP